MASVKKVWKSKRGSQEMAVMAQVDGKNFNNNNSAEFVLIPRMRQPKLAWIVVIKIFALNLCHHSHLLATPFDFTAFHTGHSE